MGMDFNNIMKVSQAWGRFTQNHPKFPGFLMALRKRGVHEGDIIAVSIIDENGEKLETNIKVAASDLELFESLKDMR